MDCHTARDLMDAGLDEALSSAEAASLSLHLGDCAACAGLWSRLVFAEGALRATQLAKPPAHLAAATLARLAAVARYPTPLRSRREELLLQAGAMAAGICLLAVSAETLFAPGQPGRLVLADAGVLAVGIVPVLEMLMVTDLPGAWSWLMQLAVAAGLALAWFGALLLPRESRPRPQTLIR